MPDPNEVKSTVDWTVILVAVLSSAITGLVAFGINWVNKKSEASRLAYEEKRLLSEERKHLNTLMLNAAIENWKKSCDLAESTVSRGHKVSLHPLDSYIVHMLKVSEVLINEKITKENIPEKLEEIRDVTNEVRKFLK